MSVNEDYVWKIISPMKEAVEVSGHTHFFSVGELVPIKGIDLEVVQKNCRGYQLLVSVRENLSGDYFIMTMLLLVGVL